MSLEARADARMTRKDLAAFIGQLADSFLEEREWWENADLESFLRAWSAWLEDMDGFFLNLGEQIPAEPSWQLVAQMLLAARVYE